MGFMERVFRWAALVLAAALLALCLAGCFSTAESRQAKQGKELMEAYLKTRDAKKTSVDSATTDRSRPAPDRVEMTEYVQGKYRIDGQEYEYWVNVRTGEIFTSERFEEYKAICYTLMLEALGIDPSRCVGLCNADFTHAPCDRVMPVEIDDPASYACGHLHSDAVSLSLRLVCSASEVPPGGWTAEDAADWNQDVAWVCVLADGEALPELGNGMNLGYYYFRDFTGDKYKLSSEAVEFTPRV